jgi:hypothetical protein
LQIRLRDSEEKLNIERQHHAEERAAIEAEMLSSGVKRKLRALEKSSEDKSVAMEGITLATERCRSLCNLLKRRRLHNVAKVD